LSHTRAGVVSEIRFNKEQMTHLVELAALRESPLKEFSYRFNRREDAEIFEQTVSRMTGVKPMPYSKVVEQQAFTPFVRP